VLKITAASIPNRLKTPFRKNDGTTLTAT